MVMFETAGAQGAFEMVHAKTFTPNPKAVTVVFGKFGLEIVPLPETKVHKPVPTIGALAVIVAVGTLKQTV